MARKTATTSQVVTLAFMDPKTKKTRQTVGTRTAAAVYGCSMGRLRQMALGGQVWSMVIDGGRRFDVEELRTLRAERDADRAAGKLGGQRPAGFSAC